MRRVGRCVNRGGARGRTTAKGARETHSDVYRTGRIRPLSVLSSSLCSLKHCCTCFLFLFTFSLVSFVVSVLLSDDDDVFVTIVFI